MHICMVVLGIYANICECNFPLPWHAIKTKLVGLWATSGRLQSLLLANSPCLLIELFSCKSPSVPLKMKRNTQPPTVRLNPFLGVEHHRRVQTAQANFRPGVVLVPGQQRYAQTGEAAKKKLCPGWATFGGEHALNAPCLGIFFIRFWTTPHATFNPRIVLSGHIECLHLVTSCVRFTLGLVEINVCNEWGFYVLH